MAARCRGAGGPRQDPQGHRSLTPAPDCGPVELGCDAGAMSDHDDDGAELWEAHAGWWQAGFTDGADPEYGAQILPLSAEPIVRHRGVIAVCPGGGRARRLAAHLGLTPATGVDQAE